VPYLQKYTPTDCSFGDFTHWVFSGMGLNGEYMAKRDSILLHGLYLSNAKKVSVMDEMMTAIAW